MSENDTSGLSWGMTWKVETWGKSLYFKCREKSVHGVYKLKRNWTVIWDMEKAGQILNVHRSFRTSDKFDVDKNENKENKRFKFWA